MKNNGFTLIEVVLALTITVGAALILSTSWSGSFSRIKRMNLNNNVALLLERKMVEMEAKHQGKKTTEIADEEGNFGDEYPDYRWTFTVQPFEMPDLTAILTSQQDGTDQLLITMLKTMKENLSKTILEGTVTVYVKSGKKEVPFNVTTYFVDYETEIPLTGGI